MPVQATIALQLYTVRDALAQDFTGTLRAIADYGYEAVETAGFPDDISVDTARAIFDDLGLTVISAHNALPLGDNRDTILDTMQKLETPYLVCPWLDPETYFTTIEGIKQACDLLNDAHAVTKSAGLTLVYHNHWFEMQSVGGQPAYKHMLDYLDPDIQFEIDTYWTRVAGLDPVEVVRELAGRTPLLHLKDGSAANITDSMVAVGAGAMDIPAILAVSSAAVHIVELDRCDSDMLTAVEESYAYLKEQHPA